MRELQNYRIPKSKVRVILVLAVFFSFLSHGVSASQTIDDSEGGGDEDNASHAGPGLGFECDQYEGDLSEYRPDMPSGDLTVDLRCWIENPNEYNITVSIAAPSSASVYDWNYGVCRTTQYEEGWLGPWWWWDTCNSGSWVITNGGQHEYNLGPSEILDLNWTISIEHGVAQMAPGFHSTDISAKVMEYGDDNTPCSEECPTILQSSIHELGSWWRMEWWGSFSSGGSACDDYWYQWNMPDETYVFCDLDLVGLDENVPLTDIMYFCRSDPLYGSAGYYLGVYGGEQWVTICEPSVESTWQTFLQSSELDQALMIRDDYDISHLGVDIDNIGPGDWDYLECPEDSLEYTVVSEYQGNIRPTGTWQVGVLVHGYNFTESSWETILGSVEGLDLPDLSEGNEARTSLEFNLTQLLDSRDYDYVFVEWVVGKGGNEFTSGIVGDCLTTSGAASIEEIVEDARFKLGISGSLNDRIVNSVKLSMEIHGRGPTTFLLLLASGLMPLVVAIPYIVLKKAIKGVITKSEVSDTHHQPAELDRLEGETNEAGGRNEAQAEWWEEMLQG